MGWFEVIMFLCSVIGGLSINRPVYKIVLTQKGYTQFLQYDIDTPPLREFTFCTWFRIYEFSTDQSIFTYVGRGNTRIVRLWVDSGGQSINVAINGKVKSQSPADIPKDVWRNVCLSYQSDFGAWALYLDSHLISCQASQSLYGFVVPGGGSVIIGYGTDSDGSPNGLEGEIFGANMILASTIEKNYTLRNEPSQIQTQFQKNVMKNTERNVKYIILSDLQTGEVNNNFETTSFPLGNATKKSFIRFNTLHSHIDHPVGTDLKKSPVVTNSISTHEFLQGPVTDSNRDTDTSGWSLNTPLHDGKFKTPNKSVLRIIPYTGLPQSAISEYEVPPPYTTVNFLDKSFGDKPPVSESIYKVVEDSSDRNQNLFRKNFTPTLSEVETPPPIDSNHDKWISSIFAGNVLNYLKDIQKRKREQKKSIIIPQTIPLTKFSDNYPYASEFKVSRLRPPPDFLRKSLIGKRSFEGKRTPQLNVQILKDDLRSNIIRTHAQIFPKNVEISNKGLAKKRKERRFYRNVDFQEPGSSREMYTGDENEISSKPFPLPKPRKKLYSGLNLQPHKFISILPFLKSLEYFIADSQSTETKDITKDVTEEVKKSNDDYRRSLSLGNKWHNVKSYSGDYSPREIQVGVNGSYKSIEETIAEVNKKHPSVLLKYKYQDNRLMQYNNDDEASIVRGRNIAKDVSEQSDQKKDSVSILKFNHGFLPDTKDRPLEIIRDDTLNPSYERKPDIKKSNNVKRNFVNHNYDLNSIDKHVKLGNALNERPVIGDNVEDNKKSFVGGDERIPDINRYRADTELGDGITTIPGSLSPRVCQNVEFYDRVLYVQPDESIDMTHIMSPVRSKNIGIEFILQNYKKCSLQESHLQLNLMLFIDWSNTPVRLFGGAYPRKTTDLCGFF